MPHADPSLSVAERVDAACDRFESEWKVGRRPQIDEYLAAAPESDREEMRSALLAIELELLGRAAADTSVTRSSVRSDGQPTPVTTIDHIQSAAASRRSIGRFEIRGVLGSGAFGKVYRAYDPHLGREVAVKVPLESTVKTDAERAQFLKEARAAATINHPNVCQVHEVGEADGRPYIVMAMVPGQSLADTLKARKGPLPEKQAALIVRKIAVALAAAHDKGIVHRDLKPANVMFDRERKDIVVMDFGLARGPRFGDARGTQSGIVMGTPAYMSPEQARGESKEVGPAGDVFSLGVILYELLTGARPFSGTATEVIGQILHVDPEPPSKRRSGIDPRLEAICLKAMAKDPAARFATMKEFAAELEAVVRTPVPAAETLRPDQTRRPGDEPGTSANMAEVFAAISADRKQAQAETAAAVEAAVAKHRTPQWVFVLAGLLLMGGLAAVAGIVFYTRSDKVKVTIELTDVDLSDKSLSFFLDEEPISSEALANPIELTPGEHVLVVKRGKAIVKRMLLTVSGGRSPGIKMKDITPREKPPTGPRLELVRELRTPSDEVSVWLSPDGLTVYVHREGSGMTPPAIYRATRATPDSPFGKSELAFEDRPRHPTLSGDERVAVAISDEQLIQARRDGAGNTFGRPAPIPELQGEPNPKSPWLSADGLTLIYQRRDVDGTFPGGKAPGNLGRTEFVVCRRSSWDRPWSKPERLPLQNDPMFTDGLTWPMLTDDGLTLFFCNGGTRWTAEVMYATRSSSAEPFGTPRKVLVDGKPVLGRCPRYVPATRELFLCWDSGTKDLPTSIDVWVVKNFVPDRDLSPTEQGFVPLFNGKDLTGWVTESGDAGNWTIKDGAIVTASFGDGPRTDTWLLSEKSFGDCIVRFEFLAEDALANSGFAIRAVPGEKRTPGAGPNTTPHPEHIQVEVFGQASNDPSKRLKTGTVIGGLGPQVEITSTPYGKQKPAGEWNQMEIEVRGQGLRVRLNGEPILDASLDDLIKRGGTFPGLKRSAGRIGFQRWGGVIRFRNIRIKELGSADDGFISLFNGKDLIGWSTLNLNYTKNKTTSVWAADPERHVLVAVAGDFQELQSDRQFKDFTLRLEWRFTPARSVGVNGSGIVVRSKGLNSTGPLAGADPQGIEIDLRPKSSQSDDKGMGTGCFTTYGTTLANHRGKTRGDTQRHLGWLKEPVIHYDGEWNSCEVTCQGDRIQVSMNGIIINEGWDADQSAGRIVLRSQNTAVEFRDIRIKELALPMEQGFVPLFNGKDFVGWSNSGEATVARGWVVKDGAIVRDKANPIDEDGREWFKNNIWTKEQYDDFVLELEFRGSGTNTLVIRADQPDHQFVDHGLHVPMSLPGTTGNYWQLGSFYPFQSPEKAARLQEEWNQLRLTAVGPNITVEVNRETINVINLDQWGLANEGKVDAGMMMILRNLSRKGHIGFNAREGEISLRNVRIKKLTPADGFTSLFNGTSLTGWKTHPDQPGGWSVEDGYLTGRSTSANHLFIEAGDYRDFHLRVECRINRFGNSGIYFGAPFAVDRLTRLGKFPTGYEAQIAHEHPKPNVNLTGSLRTPGTGPFASVTQCDLKPDEWFTTEVIANGTRIVVKINGKETANLEGATHDRGHLVLQAMSDPETKVETRVQFRKVEIRRLGVGE